MKKYLLLLPVLFTACMDSAKPIPLTGAFKAYDSVQNACLDISKDESKNAQGDLVFEKVQEECKGLLNVLSDTISASDVMQQNKNNASFYVAKEKYKKEKSRLKKSHRHLNLILKEKALDAIEQDDLQSFTKIVNFNDHPMNFTYYRYMQRHSEHFKDNEKRLRFEKEYAQKKYESGYALINRGKFTRGLGDLKLASEMNHKRASRLCGDVYRTFYPSKAQECYLRAVEAGDLGALYYIAKGYDDEDKTEEAAKWYLKSAEAGNFIAQYRLSQLSQEESVKEKWLKQAAEAGYDKAQYAYGVFLMEHGNADLALAYLQHAADQEYDAAYYPLGELFFKKKQYKKAYLYLDQADVNAEGMYMLGYLKEYGKGTSKNYYSAYDYYKKAGKLGKSGVNKDLNRVSKAKKRLQARQVKQQRAQARANANQVKKNRARRLEAELEDQRIRSQWRERAQEERRLKAEACGVEPSSKILSQKGVRVHIEGKLTHWLGRNAFIVVVNGREYYLKDEGDEAKANKGDYVNFVAVSTGKREITHGLRRSLFDDPDESAIQKAYALEFESICPY